ncbi:glycosyltransferase family 2 protein [Rhodopseudomonas palustris]|uniref:glycosyltransferase family 2 protein n=1 Tax=Rhodopseudomonas palustris TaxID=1076 RepID=UPI002ACEE64C|nr:glycosyltransferase family 2 protein [Rhodopseudomonas palustris]WQH01651.1 glycosyltransferase family 2 protein [Rhodopseudomonas palustris]
MVALVDRLQIVVPCFNEEEALPETARQLCGVIESCIARGSIANSSSVLFVDDGSSDKTWRLIEALHASQPQRYDGIRLSGNFGHQAALWAGLSASTAEMVVTIDADLQDDPNAIETMVARYHDGADIVYGVRSERQSDTWFKRNSAGLYYKLLGLLGAEILPQHADFRLMSRRAIAALLQYSETNLFLRALVHRLGFETAQVAYRRTPRVAGATKYPLGKMLHFAIDGITSWSVAPLRAIGIIGLAVSLLAFLLGLWTLWAKLFTDQSIPGWASIMLPLMLFQGLQFIFLGVIGEYVGKIFLETKRRPRFIVRETASDGIAARPDRREREGGAR